MDLFKLTCHSWCFLLEGYGNRFTKVSPEQPCIFCRDLDPGIVPRNLGYAARYQNVWMLKLLVPHIDLRKKQYGTAVPVCRIEGGYFKTPGYLPLLALLLLFIWWALLTLALLRLGLIPPEMDPFAWVWDKIQPVAAG